MTETPLTQENTDQDILILLKQQDERAITAIYHNYYEELVKKVYRIISDQQVAEDLIQELMLEIWNKARVLNIQTSLKAYLHRSAFNRTMNYIKLKKLVFEDLSLVKEEDIQEVSDAEWIHNQENRYKTLAERINLLPEKCRIVFMMSKYEEMSYAEIAKALDISVKTVENQISKAFKFLRNSKINIID